MSNIGQNAGQAKEIILNGALNPLRPFLPTALIEQWCREANHSWRKRVFGPVVTLVACVWKQLQAQASARAVEDWVATFIVPDSSRDGHDFCAARARLHLMVFERAVAHVSQQANQKAALLYHGFCVWLVDGTTMRAPRTDANKDAFGASTNILPLVRAVWLICAGSATVWQAAIGSYHDGEARLFLQLLKNLPLAGLVMGDSTFASYLSFWLAQQRQCHALCHHKSYRRDNRIRKLGYRDELHRWSKPKSWQTAFLPLLAPAPQTLDVRIISRAIRRCGYRTWTLTICTTLLNPKKYPANELIQLYLRRWNIELDIRAVKVSLELRQLTAKSPDIVYKEILSTLLAYNLVRVIMAQTELPVRSLSFERSRHLILVFSERMAEAPTPRLPQLYRDLLKLISQAVLPWQKRPPEPRCVIRHNTRYPLLRIPRQQWQVKYHAA
jgi:hypothetical protein